MSARGNYFDTISNLLNLLALSIKSKTLLGFTDDAKWAENFFRDLLNRVCGYNLVNLNTDEPNYAGIDLGDKASSLCIQVTAGNSSVKITDTLTVSDKYKRYEEYDSLVILIVGQKGSYSRSTFTTQFKDFDKERSIWDINTILAKISDSCDAKKMKELAEFLNSELGTKLTIDPLGFSDAQIASIIDVLHRATVTEPSNTNNSGRRYEIPKRGEGYIIDKNELNGVTDALFEEIHPNLEYGKKLVDFLGNPINADYQRKYFDIAEAFQKTYLENKESLSGVGDLFSHVFKNIISYDNRNEIDARELFILMHNMYFNCDIGVNPKQND